MFNNATLDELSRRIAQAISASPAKDVERNVKALLQSGLQRLNLVPRADFEIQTALLARTREKLEALEARVAEMESRTLASKAP